MQWLARQVQRVRRLAAILPRILALTFSRRSNAGELGRIGLFNGLEGLKNYCREVEQQRDFADAVQPALDAIGPDVRGYVISAPDFRTSSAGVVALYRLCRDLNARGFPSFICGAQSPESSLAAPLIDEAHAKALCRRGFTAVYPEIVSGNPREARTVARWVLNSPGLLGGDKVYDPSELVFYYSNVFLPYIHNRTVGKLYVPTIDESIFYSDDRPDAERCLECFYIGKSQWKDGYVDRENVFEITRQSPAKSELGKLFRASRALYCFDNSTILIYEAILCGCPVVIIPDGTQTRADYETLELGTDGIAWGMEELEKARADVSKLRERYDQAKRDYVGQLDNFIRLTQQRAAQNGIASIRPDGDNAALLNRQVA
jgi:O-antigen biosynthesis protein